MCKSYLTYRREAEILVDQSEFRTRKKKLSYADVDMCYQDKH